MAICISANIMQMPSHLCLHDKSSSKTIPLQHSHVAAKHLYPIFILNTISPMLIKINRQACLSKYPCLPQRHYNPDTDEEDYNYPKVFKTYILTVASKSFKGHTTQLGTALVQLTTQFHYDRLIFLGDTPMAWLYQKNDYKPAKEAQTYLVAHKVGKRFNGGLEVEKQDLLSFIKHLSWLTRCNAVLPYVYFTDSGQNMIGHICQYGNLHLDTLNVLTDNQLKAFVETSKLTYLKDNNCSDQFGKKLAITGRRIAV